MRKGRIGLVRKRDGRNGRGDGMEGGGRQGEG